VNQDRSGSVSSGASVNKDWEHWVVLHGNETVVREDVREIRQTIGVNFDGVSVNMFDALSRGGRGSKKLNVTVEGEGVEATG
ncbi:endonuclease/exonuclease/phosphatase family protein, partial [Trifolium medium]|nr:endonuclease/exonuclease/phosphatase family protein [Trifolium medium]